MKKYESDKDFKLISFKLKERIRQLMNNKVGAQAIVLLSTEISNIPNDVKSEMIEYIDFLSKKLSVNLNSIYSIRNLEKKAQYENNKFYLAQMKRLILEDKKKEKEGYFKEANYLSSNAIFIEDVEREIEDKHGELEKISRENEINARYIIEATDNNSLKRLEKTVTINNTPSIEDETIEKTSEFDPNENVLNERMQELLRQKEEQERIEMEKLRKKLAADRRKKEEEERALEEAKNKKRESVRFIRKEERKEENSNSKTQSPSVKQNAQKINNDELLNEKRRIEEAEKLRLELKREREEKERIQLKLEREEKAKEELKQKLLNDKKNEEIVKEQQEKIAAQQKELEIKYSQKRNTIKDESLTVSDFLKNYTYKQHDKTPIIKEEVYETYKLYNKLYSADEIINPTNKMYNFWIRFKNKYKINNLFYWLKNIDFETQEKVQKKRDKYEQLLDKKYPNIKRSSTYQQPKTTKNSEN